MIRINLADNRVFLKTLADNSIDAVVTDPPYGISFMNKKWDYDVPSVEVWKECLRVLKPGGHMLVACGTRTQHRMVVNIEDAGFEIRDVVTWLYGSGFPKSLDVSKAIDKEMGAERELIGLKKHSAKQQIETFKNAGDYKITAPATDAAKQWSGFGTALKPSTEHWTYATKPIEKPYSIDDEILECHTLLKRWLWLVCPAKIAVQYSMSKNPDTDVVLDFVQWLASAHDIPLLRAGLGETATFKSRVTGSTFLNIASSWNAILDVSFGQMSTFTIGTKTSLTIELRILGGGGLGITHANTTLGAPNGMLPIVPSVKSNLSEETVQAATLHSAQENAIKCSGVQILSMFANIAKILSERLEVKQEFIAQTNAMSQAEMAHENAQHCESQPNANTVENHLNTPLIEVRVIAVRNAWLKRIESEFWTLARKPLSESTVAKNMLKWGTGGINIDGCRVGTDTIKTCAKKGMYGSGSAEKMREQGFRPYNIDNREIPDSTHIGRFPANLILDEEAAAALDEQVGDLHQRGNKNPTKRGGGMFGHKSFEGTVGLIDNSGSTSASRFFYVAKSSKSDRGEGNVHPTCKPTKLMAYLCKLITPPNGTILDPFMGSGSTGVAAQREGFKFVGCELSPEYFEIAKSRLNVWL